MNYIIKKQFKLILALLIFVSIGFSSCTMDDELTVVPLKTLDEFKTQTTEYLAKEKMMVDTARVGFNRGNYKTVTDSTNVKAAYLAVIVAAQAVVSNPDVTIPQITAVNKTLTTPGKAFWAAIWYADRRALNDTIVACSALNTATLQGNLGGQVLADVKVAFTAAIAKATATRGSSVASDLLLKMAADTLSAAKKTFIAAIIPQNLADFILRSKEYVTAQKSIVESSVVGYNKGDYPVLTRTNYLNAVLAANDAVNNAGATFEGISLALTNMIAPKAVFLPFIADHRPLNDTIVIAETLNPTFIVGTERGQVVQVAKTVFTTAITTAKTARENVALTDGATKAARFKMGQAIFAIQANITLGDLILDSEALKVATPIGTGTGSVTTAVNFVYGTAITAAKTVRNSSSSTYEKLTTAIADLQKATATFTSSIQ